MHVGSSTGSDESDKSELMEIIFLFLNGTKWADLSSTAGQFSFIAAQFVLHLHNDISGRFIREKKNNEIFLSVSLFVSPLIQV